MADGQATVPTALSALRSTVLTRLLNAPCDGWAEPIRHLITFPCIAILLGLCVTSSVQFGHSMEMSELVTKTLSTMRKCDQ